MDYLCAVVMTATYHIRNGRTNCCITHLTLLKYLKLLSSEICFGFFLFVRVIVMGS
jgi:hypothetical protein